MNDRREGTSLAGGALTGAPPALNSAVNRAHFRPDHRKYKHPFPKTTRAGTDEVIDWMSLYNHRRLAFDVGLRQSDAVRAALARRSGKAG
jgi:hypothetical protein